MSDGRPDLSFVQDARRRQLVDCTIEILAEVGLAGATLTRIAERAGISRGLVNYHVTGRADLLAEVVAEVYRLAHADIGPRMLEARTPRAQLLTFVAASVRFYREHPRHMAALHAIHRDPATGDRDSWPTHRDETRDLRSVLLAGQAAGQFRAFDVDVVAAAVRAILDTALMPATSPPTDTDALVDELCELVDAATRPSPPEVTATAHTTEER